MRPKPLYILLFIALLLSACSDESTATVAAPVETIAAPTPVPLDMTGKNYHQAKISAEQGGTIHSLDGFTLHFAPGALVQDADIEISKVTGLPEIATPEMASIGPFYQITLGEAEITAPILLTLPYAGYPLPAAENDDAITLAYYSEATKEWVALPSVIDPQEKTISAMVGHFSQFVILAWPEEKPPRIIDFYFSPTTISIDCDRINDPNYLPNLPDSLTLTVQDPDGLDDLQEAPELTVRFEKLYLITRSSSAAMSPVSPGTYAFTFTFTRGGSVLEDLLGQALLAHCGNLHAVHAEVSVTDRAGLTAESTAFQDVRYQPVPEIAIVSPRGNTPVTTAPTLTWQVAWPENVQKDYDYLTLKVSSDPAHDKTVFVEEIPVDQTAYILDASAGLKEGKTYYWQVSATRNYVLGGSWATVRSQNGSFWVTRGQAACTPSDATGCVRVQVIGSNGSPAAGVYVMFHSDADNQQLGADHTDANGTLYFSGSAGEKYFLYISSSPASGTKSWNGGLCTIQIAANQILDFQAALEAGSGTSFCVPQEEPVPAAGDCSWVSQIIGDWVSNGRDYMVYTADHAGYFYPGGDRGRRAQFEWECSANGNFHNLTSKVESLIEFPDRDHYEMHGTGWTRSSFDLACTAPVDTSVYLYQHWHYECGGEGENFGWMARSATGFQTVADSFHDRASSIKIPAGWSVMLYEHPDPSSGASLCLNESLDNFPGTYSNGVPLNDTVSAFEVFDKPGCGASAIIRPDYVRATSFVTEYWAEGILVARCSYTDVYQFDVMVDEKTARIQQVRYITPEIGDCTYLELERSMTYTVDVNTGQGLDKESDSLFLGKGYPSGEVVSIPWVNQTTLPAIKLIETYTAVVDDQHEWRSDYTRHYDQVTGLIVQTDFQGAIYDKNTGEKDAKSCVYGKNVRLETNAPIQNIPGVYQMSWPLDLGAPCGMKAIRPIFKGTIPAPILVAPEKDKKYCAWVDIKNLPGDAILEWTGNAVRPDQPKFSYTDFVDPTAIQYNHMNWLEIWGREMDETEWKLVGKTQLFDYTEDDHQGARLEKDTLVQMMGLFRSPKVTFRWRNTFVNTSFEGRVSPSEWGYFIIDIYPNDDGTCGGTADPSPQQTSLNVPILRMGDFSGGLIP